MVAKPNVTLEEEQGKARSRRGGARTRGLLCGFTRAGEGAGSFGEEGPGAATEKRGGGVCNGGEPRLVHSVRGGAREWVTEETGVWPDCREPLWGASRSPQASATRGSSPAGFPGEDCRGTGVEALPPPLPPQCLRSQGARTHSGSSDVPVLGFKHGLCHLAAGQP